MSQLHHIIDAQLPWTQDFKAIRKEGLAFIQQNVGEEWSNMNASDPGITILDQVCYALTELGYCNEFEVKDILTGSDGKLQLTDQFYLPEDILTTSPVSITDYIKYLVDGVEHVKNAVIVPISQNPGSGSCVYQTYLSVPLALTDDEKINVLKAVFFYLNKVRNVGELFLEPQYFRPKIVYLKADVEIMDQAQLSTVSNAIDDAIRKYIFPDAIQTGYQQLVADGLGADQIFNGPRLLHGWIKDKNLGQKKDELNILELTAVIRALPGVKGVGGVQFVDTDADHGVKFGPGVLSSVDTSQLNFSWPGSVAVRASGRSPGAAKPLLAKGNIQLGAAHKVQTDVPRGKFRDIGSYISIQNTFPEIFAVGDDAVVSGASNPQIAQSRQLKGYLTLFDQVLANQFSQLANVGRLFSFKNAMTGAPSDERDYYAVKNAYEKAHLKDPVPYEVFSPTYFYQSPYDIPHIRPLLKGNEAFKFSIGRETERGLDDDSWQAFKQDPYNLFMRGLMEAMEEQSDNLERRNAILDHLLARHGESPVMIDMIIAGSVYSGNGMKDRVIFKSLYLQNLALLSYYRQKAFNYLGADKLPTGMEDVPANLDNRLFYVTQRDFIFDSAEVNAIERLTEHDFINYSAFELKLCLLFGLKTLYRDFIIHQGSYLKKALALWMITRRKGFIFIEMDLLLRDASFGIFLAYKSSSGGQNIYQRIEAKLKYHEMRSICHALGQQMSTNLSMFAGNRNININGATYRLSTAQEGVKNKRYRVIPNTNYSFAVRTYFPQDAEGFENDNVFYHRVFAIFPSFIDPFNEMTFRERLRIFCASNLPLPITCGCGFVNVSILEQLQPAFTAWHNALIYQNKRTTEIATLDLQYFAASLTRLITDINPESNG